MPTFIALAWHITKKDLRASRDLIIMWVLLAVAHTLLRTAWPPLTMSFDPDWIERVNIMKSTLPWMRTILFGVIVAQLVHADPLTGTDAFWLTRPISRMTMFASKLATLLLAVALPTVAAQVVPMIAYGTPPPDITRVLSEHLLYLATGLMMALAAAALTPNLRSFAALTIPLFALWLGASILIANLAIERRIASGTSAMRDREADGLTTASRQVATHLLMTVGFGVAAWSQYRTRRRERSALLVAAAAGVSFFMPYLVPSGLEARAAMTEDPAVALGDGMRFRDGPTSVVMWPLGDRDGQCGVMVRVTQVQGMQAAVTHPWPSYRFVHRPARQPLVFTYFALPHRSQELIPSQRVYDTEEFELFQVLYRYAVVGPMFESNDPHAEIKSVSCRDVDVVVRH
jgi:ABC-type transport system involved in multi-copper enzyme maturation permease subunit